MQAPPSGLPPGWEARTDPNSGAPYYVDQTTGQSTWTMPTAPPPGYVAPPAGAPPTGGPPAGTVVDPNAQQAGGMVSNDGISAAMGFNKVEGDWMMTPQVECEIPGLEKLTQVTALFIKQDLSVAEALTQGMCEFNNRYRVYNQDGNLVYNVIEESEFCCRCCCAPNHTMSLDFKDETDRTVMHIDKPFKVPPCCPVCLPFCQTEATISTDVNQMKVGQLIKQPICGGGITPKLELYDGTQVDAEGAVTEPGQLTGIVTGPTCCIGGLCCDSEFKMTGEDTEAEPWANIVKEGAKDFKSLARELVTDADNFKMNFTEGTTIQQKSQALAVNMILDYMFFEGDGAFECGTTAKGNPECSLKLFDFFCCGCLCPCKITCGGDTAEGE